MSKEAKAEPTATRRGPAHSLVPEHHTLDAGAEENHAAEVCAASRKAGPPRHCCPTHSPTGPQAPGPRLSQKTQLGTCT